METPKIYTATNVTKTEFKANWEDNGDRYYLYISDDNFSTYLNTYEGKEVTDNYDTISGLTNQTHYQYKVKSLSVEDTGTFTSGSTLTVLEDITKTWVVDIYTGMTLSILTGTASGETGIITANSGTTLTVSGLTTIPNETSTYEITDTSNFSFVMEALTGYKVYGMSIETGNIVSDSYNIKGITIEVSTQYNLLCVIKDIDNTALENVNILIHQDTWNLKGELDPNTDPVPSTPTEGDFYTILSGGTTSGYTGQEETFDVNDILVYDDSTWIKKNDKNIYSDSNGIAGGIVEFNVNNVLNFSIDGYQNDKQIVKYISGINQYNIIMHMPISIITTKNGHAVNLNPLDRNSKSFY